MKTRSYFAIGLLSASAIAFQLALMQILAITQWHHFAYMIISVALLGFGAAGTCLALFRTALTARYDRVFPMLMFLCGSAMAVGVGLSQHPAVRFDSYLLFTGVFHAGRLLLTYGIFFIPFFLAALAIGLAFTRHSRRIGFLYFWNLIGSSAGSLLALGLMWLFPPREIPAVLALIPVFSGLLAMPGKPGVPILIAAVLSLIFVTAAILRPPALIPSEFKSLSRAMQLPEAQTTPGENSPYGFMQVFSSPALRYAPGLSLTYPDAVPVRWAVFNNGDWVGPLPARTRPDALSVMDFSTAALPYALTLRKTALVLNMGTGTHAVQAIRRGAEKVTAVEPNPVLLALLAEMFETEADSLLNHPALTIINSDSRTWLLTDPRRYDLIVLPTIDTFGGTAGLNAIQEHYLFTQEAFSDIWRKLTPGGVLSVTCWMDYPPRHTLKMLATLAAMLAERGVENPRNHIAAVRSWGTITFVVKKTPCTPQEISNIRAFCRRLNFDPALLPDIRASERAFFNVLQDDLFFNHLDKLLSQERAGLYAAYAFNIRPATDDNPYFAQFLRGKSLWNVAEHFGKRSVPFFEIGYLVVFLTLLQILLAALLLIIVPLLPASRRGRGKGKAQIFFYFSGIGIGYLFVEMAMIQRFVLYFGNPIHAAAIVISTMLLASGMGSYASARFQVLRTRLFLVLAGIIVLLLFGSALLTPLMLKTIGLSPVSKFLVSLCVLFPAAFLMGIPFPAGIHTLAEKSEGDIPWAWGINGCFSVVSTALATIIAVETGFTAVMLCAALAYGCTLAAGSLNPPGREN
ncbi:MAG: spermidine synthase-like protein [Pseudomonadota bacterium]